jgi:hypothetical protein
MVGGDGRGVSFGLKRGMSKGSSATQFLDI